MELQVSLLLLGIVLGAMVPLVVMQSKQLAFLEYRWDPDSGWQASLDYWIDPYHVSHEGPVYDLVTANIVDCAQANPWARKLGAPARLVPRATTDPAVSSSAGGWSWLPEEAHNAVEIVPPTTERSVSITSDTASATVTVTPDGD
ncbi:MAG: hypothetical protein JW719_05715 [Pirellulales bacterium]|nr:hypothetical protein [Pirellulales bacterium]